MPISLRSCSRPAGSLPVWGQEDDLRTLLVLVVAQAGLQRQVDREPKAPAYATFGHRTGVRIEVTLVDVEEENRGIVVEDGLG